MIARRLQRAWFKYFCKIIGSILLKQQFYHEQCLQNTILLWCTLEKPWFLYAPFLYYIRINDVISIILQSNFPLKALVQAERYGSEQFLFPIFVHHFANSLYFRLFNFSVTSIVNRLTRRRTSTLAQVK